MDKVTVVPVRKILGTLINQECHEENSGPQFGTLEEHLACLGSGFGVRDRVETMLFS